MKIQHDTEIEISVAHSRLSKYWQTRRMMWSEMLTMCSKTHRTGETAAQYALLSKEEQNRIKDVGGFVGGSLAMGIRRKANMEYRTLVTLDIDHGTDTTWEEIQRAWSYALMVYSTHKHSKATPRYRLVMPLSRKTKPEEYEPLCRRIAEKIGIDQMDESTYEAVRLMYWPSTSKDADYFFRYQDGEICDVDKILATYTNYNNTREWPSTESEELSQRAQEMRAAGDPREKAGLIGAWCRAYTIEEAIETYLQERYKPDKWGRYTYREGTTSGGLVCYEHLWAYSHHESDPAQGRLCNAFDLVRIHLYGDKDTGSKATDVTRLPSYKAMQDLAAGDARVKRLLGEEMKNDFAEIEAGRETTDTEESEEWKMSLEYNRQGKLQPTTENIVIILENDPEIRGRVVHDLFSGADLTPEGLPWNKEAKQWTDRDDSNLRAWMEKRYGITGKEKIADALAVVLTRHSRHPIRDYLESLTWDGVERLDRLIIDYLGAEDNPLTRAMTRKHFTAAVARVMEPGCKYDHCLVLTGEEGIGKSTLLAKMGGEWFNDSIVTTEGKEGMEQLRRAWIIEMGELSSIRKSEVENVKAYLSKRTDIYRAAYARRVTEHPRQCVFCGTTNEALFLKGDNGNRRFWVVQVDATLRRHEDWSEALDRDRDQLWAEAVQRWREGEKLYLDTHLEKEAKGRQEEYNDDADDPIRGLLRKYLDTKLPKDWPTRGTQERRRWLQNSDPLDAEGTETRERVCAAEFICECIGKNMGDADYKYLSRKICKILDFSPQWERMGVSRHAEKLYGVQKSFKRVNPKREPSENVNQTIFGKM